MASLDVIRTLTIRAKTEGFDKANADVRALGQGYELSARQQLSMSKSLDQLERRFVAGAREQQEFAKVLRQVNLITAQSPDLQGRANKVLEEAGKKLVTVGTVTQQYTNQNRLARHELINLSRQIQDVGVGLASGQGVMTIAIQQGSQIADVFASGGVSLGGFARQVVAMITPMRLFIGVAGLVAGAGLLLASSWKNAEVQFLTLSERLDVPIRKLHELQAAAAVRGIDMAEFIRGMEGFGDRVNEARHGLGELGQLFRINGVQARGLEQSLFAVADLVQRAATGADRYRIVQLAGLPPTAEWVRLLTQGGDALRQAAQEFSGASEAQQNLIEQARAWDEAWSKAFASFNLGWRAAFGSMLSFASDAIDKITELFGGVGAEIATGLLRALGPIGQVIAAMLDQLTSAAAKISTAGGVTAGPTTKIPSVVGAGIDLEQRRIQLLGEFASVQERVRLKELEIQQARQQGVALTNQEAQALLSLAQAQAEADKIGRTVSALGEAATAAERYEAELARLNVALASGALNQNQFNRALLQIQPVMKTMISVTEDLGTSLAQAFIQGQSGAQAFNSALKGVGATAASGAIKSLLKGDIVQAGLQGLISVGSSLIGKIFGGKSDEQKAQEAAAAQAAAAAQQQAAAEASQRAAEAAAEAARLIEEAAEKERQAAGRRLEFADREFLAQLDTSTLAGALAEFENRAVRERQAEIAAGGQAMAELERAIIFERLAIEQDFARKQADLDRQRLESIAQRNEALGDRVFAALTDTDTLSGALAEFERNAQKQRRDEIAAGGELISQLEETLALERLAIYKRFNDRLLQQVQNLANTVNQFLFNLKVGPQSTLAPIAKLAEAQTQYNDTLAQAQAGNFDAANAITGYASQLLEAAKNVYGSTGNYSTLFNTITTQLEALPAQVSAAQHIVDAVNENTDSVDAGNLIAETQKIVLDAINATTASTNSLATSTNSLTSATNSLINSNNSLLGQLITLNTSMNANIAFLDAINVQMNLNRQNTDSIRVNAGTIANATNFIASWTPGSNHATGGWVTGGTPGRDSVSSVLMPGEFVIRQSIAQANRDWLPRFNQSGSMPYSDEEIAALLVVVIQEIKRVSAVTAASAEYIREPLDQIKSVNEESVREQKFAAA